MPIIGIDTKPSYSYHAYGGTSQPNQEAELVDLPAQRIRITRLGVWLGGWNDAPRVTLTIWDVASGAVLAQTAQFTVANAGAAAEGHIARYEADLVAPYDTPAAGGQLRVGFTRDRADAHQVTTGGVSTYGHDHGRAGYPAGGFAEIDGGYAENRRIGCWIQDYVPLANAWVMRSGVWQRATPAVFRSGSWQDADAVKVFRSGVWQDAD